ncbi:MAG: GntR family transcriptional regulator [Burkholderiaceae bacterium]|nr:GntR family transcriptional regulator [Burkholderiaceae bacterium]
MPDSLIARYHAATPELPKHARLRGAIMAAVKAGELTVGAKIPGERELSERLGVSLGTTQKALGRLVDEGFLVRRQGHGTFVGSVRRPVARSWHYRFLDEDGQAELPVFATLLERRVVDDDGPWAAALGADPKGYVMVQRRLDIGNRFACSSRLYLPASRFGRLLRVAARRLTDANLKTLLEKDFAAPTLASDGVAHVVHIGIEDATIMGVAPRSCGLQVHIVGRSFSSIPITFQRMLVPAVPHGLRLDFHPPADDPEGSGAGTGRSDR